MTHSQLDLSKLALKRTPPSKSVRPHRRRWISRYVIPASILVGFAVLLILAAGRQLMPKVSVTVVPVIVERAGVQPAGVSLFQAAGWIEPRPTLVSVPALTPGVIDRLLVVEGQPVSEGEPIARLIRVDAELAVEQAKATLDIRKGELQRVVAEHAAAMMRLENPVHLHVPLADAKSLLARATTEKQKLPFLIDAAEAQVSYTKSSLVGKQAAKSAIAGVVVEEATKDHAAAVAALAELSQRGPNLAHEIQALQEKVDALSEQLDLRIEEHRQEAEAKAKVSSAKALRDEAQVRLRLAELSLERTIVRAPIDGRVLRLVASPGTRVMGLPSVAGHSSSTVVEMYDPERLQVRADVRLEDVPLVTPGAPVEIETASSGKVIQGRVLRPTSSANVQKNTLEVKVELVDPPATVSPEMLVTASFLAPQNETEVSPAENEERLLVPHRLVHSQSGAAFVWRVDAEHRAKLQFVKVGREDRDGLVEILDGLNATDKVIASGTDDLSDGDAVVIRGEDQGLGVES